MKKLIPLIFALILIPVSIGHANMHTPATDITSTTGSFSKCLGSNDTNVQQSLNDIDGCFTSIGGNGITKNITQTAHGFSVGNVIIFNGTNYILAQADNAADAEVVGIVSAVQNPNSFTILMAGYINGISGLTPGTTYFLSPSTPGALSNTNPTGGGTVSKPLLIADSTTSGYFNNMRGFVNPGTSAFNVTYLGNNVTYLGNQVTYNP